MIKNILLDLDDTILDFGKSESESICKTLLDFGIEPSRKLVQRYSQINAEHWQMFERGEIDRQQVLLGRFEVFLKELNCFYDAEKMKILYENYLKESVYFVDGAIDMLNVLTKKYRLFLVSNGTAKVQDRRIELAGIEKYFNGIFISERVGCNKPSLQFFEQVFSVIDNFLHNETIILGDSISSDILGGRNANIITVLFDDKKKYSDSIADYKISKLSEFVNLIDNL